MICVILLLFAMEMNATTLNHTQTNEETLIRAQTNTRTQTQMQTNEKRNGNRAFIRRLAGMTEWINTGQILPREDRAMGIGYTNDTFYLFGMFGFIYFFVLGMSHSLFITANTNRGSEL